MSTNWQLGLRSAELTLALGLCLVASAAAEEIYLSEYTAIIPDWHPEAEVDVSPQEERGMIIFEVTRFPHLVEPRPKHMTAAVELLEKARANIAARGWDDFERAVADGFELMFEDDNHYALREHITDGITLDPERPEFLIYYDTPKGKRLAGLMFLAQPDEHGPQIAGPMSLWHFHIWNRKVCLWQELLVSGFSEGQTCPDGIASHRSPEMLHLWFFDHPQGMFATNMDLEPWQLKDLETIEY
jgi:hypothetical protein